MTSPRIIPSKYRQRRSKNQPTFLSMKMQTAAKKFADEVGAPKFNARGCRNFRDWLAELRHPRYRSSWKKIAEAMGRELFRHHHRDTCDLQEEVVREVIRCVLKPSHDETHTVVPSSVSRHSTTSRSGNTLRSVFESQLDSDDNDSDSTYAVNSCPDPLEAPTRSDKPGDATTEECTDPAVEGVPQKRSVSGSITGGLPSFQEVIAASLIS